MTSEDEADSDQIKSRIYAFIIKWRSGWASRDQANLLADDLAEFMVACVRGGELGERIRCARILRSHPSDLPTALSLIEMGGADSGNTGTD